MEQSEGTGLGRSGIKWKEEQRKRIKTQKTNGDLKEKCEMSKEKSRKSKEMPRKNNFNKAGIKN